MRKDRGDMQVLYDSKSIANYFLFCVASPQKLTHMKLHKLLYYSHGWHLGVGRGPLLDEMIEAWEFGPVIPSVFHEFKDIGSRPIDRAATVFNPSTLLFEPVAIDSIGGVTRQFLDRIATVYFGFSDAQLARLVHLKGSPWEAVRRRRPNVKGVDIPNELFVRHFGLRLEAQAHLGGVNQ